MKTILPFSRFLFFVFLITNLLFANISFGQIVMLDQADLDYAPGETVYISGSGWQPGETVMLEVDNLTNPNVDCGPVTPQPHESWTTVADENGNFTASWYVNDCELGADLMLGALGSSSGFTYEVFFTDANVKFTTTGLPNGINVTVSYSGSISGSVTFSTSGSGASNNIALTGIYSFTYPSIITDGVNTYSLLSTTPISPTNIQTNGSTTIAGNYGACIAPAPPTVNSPVTYCQGSSSNPLTATGDNLLWYTSASGGTGSATAPTPSTTSLGTTSYYVSQTIGCESPRAKIDVVINGVNPGVIGKGATQPGPGCGTLNPGITSEVMAASGPGTISYIWQVSTDNGGNWTTVTSATSSQYNPDSFATTTSFKRIATSTLNGIGCSAESNVLTYEVNPIPVVASILPGGTTNVCVGSSFQLSNATLGGVWNSANPAIAIVSTNGLVTGIAPGDVSITYTVTDVNTGCSKAANKTIHVLALPTAPTAVNYSGVYDGASHTGAATSNLGEEIDWYTTATGTIPTVAPVGTNVGTYSAYAEARNTTSGCKSATRTLVTVVITPKAATVTANAKSKTYGDLNPTLNASVTGTVNGDVLDYSLATTATQFSSVGDYPITVTLGSNPNYNVTPTNGLLTIDKRSVKITADAKSKTYGDSDPALTYQITSGSLAFSDAFSGSLSRDAGESIGAYAITQGNVALNSNYTLTYVGANLTIDKRSVEITADAKSKTYGDSDPVLTYQITSGSLAFSDVFSGSLSRDAGENVGAYAITQGSLALNNNYILTYVGADLTIGKRSVEITADAKSKTYGDSDPVLIYQITSGSLAFSDVFSGSLSRDAGESVGAYAITQGNVALNSNYTLTYVGDDLTIGKRSIEITADAKSKTYGDTDPVLTYLITSGSLAFSDAFSGSLSRDAGETIGDYAITQGSVALNSNYTLTYVGADLTIDKRSIEITADTKSKTYGDSDPVLTYQITSGSLAFSDAFSGSLSRDAGESIGAYAITQGNVALNSNYSLTYVGADLTIGKRSVEITADAKSKTYGDADPALTYQITSGSLAFSDAFSGSLSRDAGESVGNYAIIQGSVALNSNYTLTYVGADLTIGKRSIEITADAKSKTYGDADPALTYQITSGSLAFSDAFSGSLSRDAGESVGNYAITKGNVALNSNYTLTYVGADLTIGKRSIEITADAKSKTYGDADPALTYQITSGSLAFSDAFSGSLSRDTGESIGDYAITQGSVALNSNYTLTYVGADLTIDKRSIEITADAKSKTYGDADPVLTYQITSGSLAFSDAFSGSLSRDAGENVGAYAITQGSLALNNNYTLTYVGADLTIDKRSIEITADAKSKTYGDSDPVLTYQITSGSLAFSDAFSGSLSRDAGETIGDYAITQGNVALNSNYTLTYVGADLTIGKRSIEITADAKSKTYGDSDPVLTYQITSGSLAFSDVFSGSLNRDAGESVGTYAITQGNVALNSNYTLTYVGADLTIGKRSIEITADAKSKTYGDSDPVLTYQITSGSLAFSDAFSGSLNRDAGESVGTYAITQGNVALNSNYTLTYVGADLTIGKRAITITADAKFKCFGSTDPALTAQVTSGTIVSGDLVTGALTRNIGESAGIYTVNKGTYTYGNNYNETYIAANLIINSQITAEFTRTNPNHYFGMSGNQTSVITVTPSGGTAPYTISISMDRTLISNYMTNDGDESWIPDTSLGIVSNVNTVLPNSGALGTTMYPSTTVTNVSGSYSITVGLLADAGFTATITDLKGCTIATEKIFIHGEDVRCFAGKSGNAKVKICHKTGNAKNPCQELCVDESAVAAHLAHGDFLGSCTVDCVAPKTLTKSSSMTKEEVLEEEVESFNIIAYPNPSSNHFTIDVKGGNDEKTETLIYDMSARLIKTIEKPNEESIQFGEDLPRGEYLILVKQGENQKSTFVIKK